MAKLGSQRKALLPVVALKEDAHQGWVWLMAPYMPPRGIVRIRNPETGRSIYCEALQIDRNFLKSYNQPGRRRIEDATRAIVMGAWYRAALGGIEVGAPTVLEIEPRNSSLAKFLACKDHPQSVVRLGAWLGLIGAALGVVGLALGLMPLVVSDGGMLGGQAASAAGIVDLSQPLQISVDSRPTEPDNHLWVPLITGASAILGAAVVAVTSLFAGRQTLKATRDVETKKLHVTLVTSERLRWLQDLRGRLSILYADLDWQRDLIRRPVHPSKHETTQRELDEISKRVMVDVNNIHLMLSPDSPHQRELRNALQEALALVMSAQDARTHAETSENYSSIKNRAFKALTLIGRDAWDKVKKLQ